MPNDPFLALDAPIRCREHRSRTAASIAIYSPDERYRYILSREWDADLPKLPVIGLNPSTATETVNDPTVRRCIDYAKRWGFGGLVMLNLFAFRATDPAVMLAAADPVGPVNDTALALYADAGRRVLAAWGALGHHLDRGAAVTRAFRNAGVDLVCLGRTKAGHPRHPLYMRADLSPEAY